MSRAVKDFVIGPEGGRDNGKCFVITEMDAISADIWGTQAVIMMCEAGLDVPGEAKGRGMEGLAMIPEVVQTPGAPMSTVTKLKVNRALQDQSLIDWWSCVKFQPENRALMPQAIIQGAGCQIEEIRTVTMLRHAVLDMHLGFFSPEKESTMDLPSSKRGRRGSSHTPI
jgi:hypothetical protein